MLAFAVVLGAGIVVAVTYLALAARAFLRVRARALAGEYAAGAGTVVADRVYEDQAAGFNWKAGLGVVASTAVIALISASGGFWYLPPLLAVGSSIAVIAAFLLDPEPSR